MTCRRFVLCSSVGATERRSTLSIHRNMLLLTFTVLFVLNVTMAVPVNVALNKPVTALYTCGKFGQETFNTLSDAYRSVSERPRRSCASIRPSGSISTGQSSTKKPTYPPEAMVDGSPTTYWQSVSRSRTYLSGFELKVEMTRELEAMIDIDLLQEFLAESMTIQLGDALSPQKISIHKSVDGKTFRPWIYAVSNLDFCSGFFGTTFKTVPTSLTDTLCIGYLADEEPPGDVFTVNISQVPVSLKEWNRVRYVKIKFYDMLFAYPYNSLANNFNHYAVQEITLMAECPCNGLQTGCEINPSSGMYECLCGGNTRGRFCELCLPLYNQFAFQFGQPCEACNCFQHATSCFYQASVEAEGSSIDQNGEKRGGGVCTDCQHNTAGINCEKCADLYYRPAGRLQTAVDACVLCQCNASGSAVNPDTNLVDCLMNDDQASADGKVPGDCYCKANVMGSNCDECKAGFYNLQQTNEEGCTPCGCNSPGTVGGSGECTKDMTGQCTCKTNVEGRACDQCKDGFYGLTNETAEGCAPCNCDVGGAVSQTCDKITGQCVCRSENIIGRACDSIHTNLYYPSPHGISLEMEDSFGDIVWKRDLQYAGFSGRGYAVANNGSTLSVLLNIPKYTELSNDYIYIITYRTSNTGDITIQLDSAASEDSNSTIPLSLPACSGRWCDANSELTQPMSLNSGPNLLIITVNTGQVFLDKLVAFPVEYLNTDSVLSYSLPDGCDLFRNTLPSDPASAEICQAAIFSITMYYLGGPLPCNCDVTGSVGLACNVSFGQCECQPGVVDRTCDKCAPGYYGFSSTGCSACNCDEYGADCDSVTGQCSCPDYTMGRQCQFCVPNTWGWNKTQGCKTCGCSPLGSITQQCNATTGSCLCRIGVEGEKCDRCQDGYYNLTSQGCAPCLCNEAGSENTVCNKTSGQCVCKANTEGRQCDTCQLETYGLDVRNAGGCLDCVCMGVTTECTSSTVRLTSAPYQLLRRTDTGVASTLGLAQEDGTTYVFNITLESSQNMTTELVLDLSDTDPRLFWKMPDTFLAQLLSLYGSDVTFTINYVIVSGQILTDHKALLIDTSGNVITYPLGDVTQGVDSSHAITVWEIGWQKDATGTTVTRAEFLKFLSKPASFLLPASFGDGQHITRLSRLEFSVVSTEGKVNTAVEACVCGDEYTGLSCQACTIGYHRENVSTSDYFGQCVRCECYSHTALCDADTAVCMDCLHNTGGDQCEYCLPGFYGDATLGKESDCTACPCLFPRVVNATCEMVVNSTDVVCSFCQDGYVGDFCDQCDLLYYGNPQDVNGTCLPCECNGNSDSCDSITGVCDSCMYNTTGDNCQSCVTGFYGNATQQNCQECGCLPDMSNSTVCDSMTGQCQCKYGVGGRTCDQCLMGFWGYNSPDFEGCRACGCLEAGSVSIQCDNDTGACSCKANTAGALCDTCQDGFFGLPAAPCEACACDSTGSVDASNCSKTSGQCQCQPGVGGRQCDQCLPFFVNFTTAGCDECGQCPKSLGDNVQTQMLVGAELLNKTLEVLNVQQQDVRLQRLTTRLNQSLDALGLAGSSATSINDIVQNVSNSQTELVSRFGSTETKANILSTNAQQYKDQSEGEVTKHSGLAGQAANLSSEVNTFERTLNVYNLYLSDYNTTASQYLNRGGDGSGPTLRFSTELTTASTLLAEAQNISTLETAIGTVQNQANEAESVNNSVISLSADLDNNSLSVTNLSSRLTSLSYTMASVENNLGQADVFKSQAVELRDAVTDILNHSTTYNSMTLSSLSAARAAVRNTNSIISGNAIPIMSGGDFLPFPSGVTNFETGKGKLSSLHTAIPLLIDRVRTAVNQSEVHVVLLEAALTSVKSSYQNISAIGTDAVSAIEDFESVVDDLDTSTTTVDTAKKLIEEVQGNVTGEKYSALEQEYTAEKSAAEAWRAELMALDFQPQVIQTSIETAGTRLDSEDSKWSQADAALDTMRTAAQSLNSQIQSDTLNDELARATVQIGEAETTSQTVSASVANQASVLDLKQAELGLIQEQLNRTQQLDVGVRQRLTSFQTRYDAFQRNLTSANTLSQTVTQKSTDVADKIQALERKLADAESLLSQLRQPVNFDGSLGLELRNPVADVSHLTDDVEFEMRKPLNFTDGVVFFVDNPNTATELEVGLFNNEIFFEFNTGSQNIRVTSPADICDNCWTRIYASRYGNVGHLTVTLMSTGGLVSNSARNQFSGNAENLTLSSNLYVGSLPDTKQTTKVANRNFIGCLHNLKYQGEELSLWTTGTGTNQQCCLSPPTLPEIPTTPGASFSGFGYLVLSPALQFSVTQQLNIEFRAFSPNGTIMKVISADGNTYTSIHLSNSYVVWETRAGGALYTVRSANMFASGRWVQISAELVSAFRLSVQYVDDPSSLVSSNIPTSNLNLTALDGQNILIGSASDPSSVGYRAGDTNFAGCLKTITLTIVSGTTPLNFSSSVVASLGVSTDGCYEDVSAGLWMTSDSSFGRFTVLPGLQQLSSLSFDVVTYDQHGVLLYISAPGALRFLYVAVFGGNVILIYRQDSAAVTIVSSGHYISDGQSHTIQVDCLTRRISIKVDGTAFEEVSQSLSVTYLAFSSSAVLQVGSVAEDVQLPAAAPVRKSLVGGIVGLNINQSPVLLVQSNIDTQNQISFAGVPTPDTSTPPPPVSTPAPQGCGTAPIPTLLDPMQGFEMDGSQEINWSQLESPVELRENFERNFVLTINFSAYKADGVLLYVADLLQNPSRYFTIYLLNGLLHLKMRTNQNRDYDIQLKQSYSDARQYELRVVRINDFVSMDITDINKDYVNNNQSSEIASLLALPTSSVYVGGVGLNDLTLSALPSQLKTQPNRAKFAGALYSVHVRSDEATTPNITLQFSDLDRTIYPAVPRDVHYGVSLSGVNSYLLLANLTTPMNFVLELTFTTVSESGLFFLFDRANAARYFAMDMNQSELRLHMNPSYNGITEPLMLVVYNSANLCDGQPHTVRVEIQNSVATATVDGNTGPQTFIPASHTLQVFYNADGYIGGYNGDNRAVSSDLIRASLTGCVMSLMLTTGPVGQENLRSFDLTQHVNSSAGASYSCPY